MPREPPREVSPHYGQILLALTIHALHYIEPSTRDRHPYHVVRH